jgi:hypothetical protein
LEWKTDNKASRKHVVDLDWITFEHTHKCRHTHSDTLFHTHTKRRTNKHTLTHTHIFALPSWTNRSMLFNTNLNNTFCADKNRVPGVDLTNLFTRSFYVGRSQKREKSVKLSVSFCTFGVYLVKAEHKMRMKLAPSSN